MRPTCSTAISRPHGATVSLICGSPFDCGGAVDDPCRPVSGLALKVVELEEAGRDDAPHTLWRAAVSRWLGRVPVPGKPASGTSLRLPDASAACLGVRWGGRRLGRSAGVGRQSRWPPACRTPSATLKASPAAG